MDIKEDTRSLDYSSYVCLRNGPDDAPKDSPWCFLENESG